MDINYNVGQRLLVELEGECFVGDLNFVSKDQSRIELSNVYEFQTGEKITGNQIYYKSDIKSIKLIKTDCVEQNSSVDSDEECGINDSEKPKTTHLTACELEEIDKISKNAQYIYKTDRHYHDAIKDMRKHSEIVLILEGSHAGRNCRTSVLTMATRQHVYIFDVLSLGRIYPEIKDILEANRPKKIIHDARKTVDNLKYRQDIELKGIFDTYAAHIGVGGDKSIWDLNSFIKVYLNLPGNAFISEQTFNWHERPFDDKRKSITSKKALFTFKLYDCILHDHILKNVYKQFELFANVYSNNKDSVEVASDMASNKNSSVDDIEYIDLGLAVSAEDTDR